MKNKNLGVFSALAAGALWGTVSIFLYGLSDTGLTTMQICFLRSLFSILFVLGIILAKDKSLLKIKWKDIWLFFCTGCISLTLFDFCYFITIQQSEASIAVAFLYTSPVFVAIISRFLFGDKITLQKVLAIVIALIGTFFVSGIFGMNSLPIKLLLTGVAAGLTYGLYSIFGRIAAGKYSSMTITFYTFVFSALSQLPFAKFSTLFAPIAARPVSWLYIIGLALFNTVLPYLLFTLSLGLMESSKAAVLATVEVVAGALFGILLFHESCTFPKILGLVMIITSTVIMNIDWKKKEKSPKIARHS